MKIDLCKIFGVEEGEEFKIGTHENPYRIYNNSLQSFDTDLEEWRKSSIMFNYVISSDIIKLPKKKEFTDDELAIMRSLPIEINWIARDSTKEIFGYEEKPSKHDGIWYRPNNGGYRILSAFSHIFKEITAEDKEPVFISDYVDRY